MGKLLIEAHYTTELCHDQTQSNQSDRLPGKAILDKNKNLSFSFFGYSQQFGVTPPLSQRCFCDQLD